MVTDRILLFGGTTEGRRLAQRLEALGADFTLSVATDYGRQAVADLPAGRVQSRRLTSEQISAMLGDYSLVIDATHPYANEVTRNIKTACEAVGIEYIRVVRDASAAQNHEGILRFGSCQAAAEHLSNAEGAILLTTGSKDVASFTRVRDYKNRVFIRILPCVDSLRECLELGFKASNIICMQGSFSKGFNLELLRATGASFLVTKDSGDVGGFADKIDAALSLGVVPIVISRPSSEGGYTLGDVLDVLSRRFSPAEYKRFPIFVDLSDKIVTVVGGGRVAQRRVVVLLDFAGEIRVISPTLTDELHRLSDGGRIIWTNRAYQNGDLEAAHLCVAATDRREVNSAVAAEAKRLGIPCSVADSKNEGGFWFPGVVRADNLVVGVISDAADHRHVKSSARVIKGALLSEAENRKQGKQAGRGTGDAAY